MRLPAILTLLVLGACPVIAGCGGDGGGGEDFRVPGDTLTIYSSLPRTGDSAPHAEAVAAGQRLALEDAGAKVGRYRVQLVQLDASEPDDRSWDPELVRENAERAVDDETTIAYLGELEYGGSAVSVPITNDRGILQVSPHDGLTSLTQAAPGGPQGGTERYYPEERRNFMRVVPIDRTQARALVEWAQDRGAARIAVAHDDRLFGRELASEVVGAAARARLEVTAVEEVRPSSDGYADHVERLAEGDPQAVIHTGMAGDAVAPLLAALERALPGVPVYASSGIANTAASAATFDLVRPAFPPAHYPRSGRRVLARLERRRGAPVPVGALYGYEAMDVVLDAIRAAGDDARDRERVIEQALRPRMRRGVIGSYRVGPTGDVNITALAAWRSERGQLRYLGARDPGPAPARRESEPGAGDE